MTKMTKIKINARRKVQSAERKWKRAQHQLTHAQLESQLAEVQEQIALLQEECRGKSEESRGKRVELGVGRKITPNSPRLEKLLAPRPQPNVMKKIDEPLCPSVDKKHTPWLRPGLRVQGYFRHFEQRQNGNEFEQPAERRRDEVKFPRRCVGRNGEQHRQLHSDLYGCLFS